MICFPSRNRSIFERYGEGPLSTTTSFSTSIVVGFFLSLVPLSVDFLSTTHWRRDRRVRAACPESVKKNNIINTLRNQPIMYPLWYLWPTIIWCKLQSVSHAYKFIDAFWGNERSLLKNYNKLYVIVLTYPLKQSWLGPESCWTRMAWEILMSLNEMPLLEELIAEKTRKMLLVKL